MSSLHQLASWWSLTAKCWTKRKLLTCFLFSICAHLQIQADSKPHADSIVFDLYSYCHLTNYGLAPELRYPQFNVKGVILILALAFSNTCMKFFISELSFM